MADLGWMPGDPPKHGVYIEAGGPEGIERRRAIAAAETRAIARMRELRRERLSATPARVEEIDTIDMPREWQRIAADAAPGVQILEQVFGEHPRPFLPRKPSATAIKFDVTDWKFVEPRSEAEGWLHMMGFQKYSRGTARARKRYRRNVCTFLGNLLRAGIPIPGDIIHYHVRIVTGST